MGPVVEVLTPPRGAFPCKVMAFRCPVSDFELSQVSLVNSDEVASFVTQKRREEHLSGRWLLAHALLSWGLSDVDLLEIRRDENRAPSLAWLHGVWKNEPLPSISIGHGNGWAYVALAPSGFSIGIDAEPVERMIAENAFDMMAKGEELDYLRENPKLAIRTWTAKEAIQKAMRLGMHLNPRSIEVFEVVEGQEISIEKSILQLENWTHNEAHISLAIASKDTYVRSEEDDLLDATREAMQDDPDWGVGCNTTRNSC